MKNKTWRYVIFVFCLLGIVAFSFCVEVYAGIIGIILIFLLLGIL